MMAVFIRYCTVSMALAALPNLPCSLSNRVLLKPCANTACRCSSIQTQHPVVAASTASEAVSQSAKLPHSRHTEDLDRTLFNGERPKNRKQLARSILYGTDLPFKYSCVVLLGRSLFFRV